MTGAHVPRVVVAGLSGDAGKTLVSLGLVRAAARRGLAVWPFKKGPDYIDAAWLAAAAGRPCSNLDTFLMAEPRIRESVSRAVGADLVVVEGNRGLFDGVDGDELHSTAALAKLLAAPVLLVVDVTKVTRTAAAMVLGCQELDPRLHLGGVVLNRVATERQEAVVRRAIGEATGLPVLGAVPRLDGDDPLPGRHLGLVTVADHPSAEAAIERAADLVEASVDLESVLELAGAVPALAPAASAVEEARGCCRVGYFSDAAFSFYYPENLEGLRARGAELVAVDPMATSALPAVDALYIGGGFPEVHAERLAANTGLAADVRARAGAGLPVYAECGGLMYLARELVVGGSVYPMAGVLDLVVEQRLRPQGHGYELVEVDRDNPFFEPDATLRGHEFHYSRVVGGADRQETVLSVRRGTGVGEGRDGIVKGRVFASYLHLHELGAPGWSNGFLELARVHARERERVTAWA